MTTIPEKPSDQRQEAIQRSRLICDIFEEELSIRWGAATGADSSSCTEFPVSVSRIVLDVNPLDLIERQFLVHAVVELRGAGRFVAGDAGGGFQIPAVAQVLGDAGPPKAVSRDFIG